LVGGNVPAQQVPARPAPQRVEIEPELDAAVHRYFETQEKEDVPGYMEMWSSTVQRPSPAMLRFIFDAGDDQYSEITILRATRTDEGARIRVGATRARTTTNQQGVTSTNRSRMVMSLVYVQEAGSWKLLREGPASDDLAAALLEASTEEARQQLLAADKDLVDGKLVDALSRRGTDFVRGRQYAAAQGAYERAVDIARRVGDRKAEGEALQNLANAFYYQRNFPRALESYEQRLTIERERHDDAAIAAALVGVAIIRYSYAEYGVALSTYREALALQEKLTDQAAVATTLISTGNVLYLLGDFPASIADYRRSREIYRASTDTEGEAKALGGLARVYAAQGDLAAALDALAGVLAEGRARSNRLAQGAALMSIGEVHVRLGNLAAGRSAFEESRGHFEAEKDLPNVGRAWQGLAFVDLLGGTFPTAEREYRQSAEACAAGNDTECFAAATVGLGFAQTSQDKFAEAVTSYKRAIDAFTASNAKEQAARARIGLAQALSGLEEFDAAISAAREARQDSLGLSVPDIFWRALIAEARAFGRSGRLQEALGSARAAIYAVDEMREAARLQPGSPLPRDTATAFATLARLQAANGDAAGAFDTSEQMRVHDLRAALTANEREIARGMTAAERDEERTAATAVVSLRAQRTRERGLWRPDQARLAELDRKLDEAVARRTEQQDRLFARLPDLRVWRGLFEPARSDDIATILEPDALLLDFVVDEDGLVAIAAWLDDGQLRIASKVSPVPRRALAEVVVQLSTPATLKDPVAWKKVSAPIVDALPAGALDRATQSRHVIVVPHEMLWRLPFEALPAGDGHLGAASPVTYTPAISSRLSVRRTINPNSAESSNVLLAVAAPAVPAALLTQITQTAPDWVIRAPEGAEREVKLATGDREPSAALVLTGAAATKKAVREAMVRASVIHIAAPFRVNGASVLFSPILLSGPAGPTTEPASAASSNVGDAVLDLRDVFNLDSQARVSVLSDGAALAMRDAASELGVVQWAWRAAGVHWVVVSRWPSDNGVREIIVRELQKQLRSGKSPDEALVAARQAVQQKPVWKAPFYWAGWIAVGGS
jgi:tetratricopeptide (TPR) repeat protein/CHAT domain-containing protein